jgi:signal recognition particle GTPase
MQNQKAFWNTMQDLIPKDSMPQFPKEGGTYKDIQSQLNGVMQMGSIGKLMEMIPGMSGAMSGMNVNPDAGKAGLKSMMCILDSLSEGGN